MCKNIKIILAGDSTFLKSQRTLLEAKENQAGHRDWELMRLAGDKKDNLVLFEVSGPGTTFPHLCLMKS